MNLDINALLFIGFLVANFIIGLWSARGIKSIREYAIGDRNFSTATLVATIVATWISGSAFFNKIYEVYTSGLYYLYVGALGPPISLLTMAYIYAPRMSRFMGKISIAEVFGQEYGTSSRVITAIAGIIASAGRIAVQFKVAGMLFNYATGIDEIYGVLVGAMVIITYSSLGGIKSVTFTDVMQFLTFGIILPMICFYLMNEARSLDDISAALQKRDSFNYLEVFDFTRPQSLYYLFLFFYMILPSFDPPMFQRVSMAKNVEQASTAFGIASIIYFLMSIVLIFIALLVLTNNPDMNPKEVAKHVIFNYSYDGLMGLTLVCIMAMVMSTADSYVNCSAVMFSHDLLAPLKIKVFKNQIIESRVASVAIGLFSLVVALKGDSIYRLILSCNCFYMPIVSVPFTCLIFGLRTDQRPVLIGMSAGLATVLLWYYFNITIFDPIVPGMAANLIFLMMSHYILVGRGKWSDIEIAKLEDGVLLSRKISSVYRELGDIKGILSKSAPITNASFFVVGVFCMVTIYAIMYSLPQEISNIHYSEIQFLLLNSLMLSTILLSKPIWPWKSNKLISSILWHFVIFSVLIVVPVSFVILTKFGLAQFTVLMINLIIIAGLLRWQLALVLLPTGIMCGMLFAGYYFSNCPSAIESLSSISLHIKFVYIMLLMASVIVVIFRPKQEYQDLLEETNSYLFGKIDSQEQEIHQANDLKNEFIRNMQHEYNAPMTGVISLAEGLLGAYPQLTDKERLETISMILFSAKRVTQYDENLTTLAKLTKLKYSITKEKIDLTELLIDRIVDCKKFYNKDNYHESREFVLNIQNNVSINADKKYLCQLIDNLIINAIKYCPIGKIIIDLYTENNLTILRVEDEGLGIPAEELFQIFEPFFIGSRTKTIAGGRGTGLAVVKKIADGHEWQIDALSPNGKGAVFTLIMKS
ncbi:MAG: ATP-binding protein [Rickettsiaceae bacterium]|nr:ATP-binding protein [Rickettsiaceae bacterium]